MDEVPGFRLVASAVSEDLHRVRLSGEVDFTCAESLAESLIFFNGTSVELDVSELTFIDAGAVGAMVKVKQKLQSQGCDLYVTGAQGIVRRALEVVGPDDWAGAE